MDRQTALTAGRSMGVAPPLVAQIRTDDVPPLPDDALFARDPKRCRGRLLEQFPTCRNVAFLNPGTVSYFVSRGDIDRFLACFDEFRATKAGGIFVIADPLS